MVRVQVQVQVQVLEGCGWCPFCCYLTRLPLPLILCSLFATAKINWQLRGQQFLLGNQFSLTMQPDRCGRLFMIEARKVMLKSGLSRGKGQVSKESKSLE